MESLGNSEGNGGETQGVYYTTEQLALQGLVDEVIRRADEKTFAVLNKILERVRNEC